MLWIGNKKVGKLCIGKKAVGILWIGRKKVYEADDGTWNSIKAWQSDKIWIKESIRKKYGTDK